MIAKDNRDPSLTADRIRELFDYDPETGVFTRRVTVWHNAVKGTRVGSANSAGHLQIWVQKRFYMAHRLAWLWMTGEWPTGEIDHINQIKSDNRWSNLRIATRAQNLINRGHKRKHALPRGVHQVGRRFQAQIRENGRFRHIGMFGCSTAAHLAWLAAANRRDAAFLPEKLKGGAR